MLAVPLAKHSCAPSLANKESTYLVVLVAIGPHSATNLNHYVLKRTPRQMLFGNLVGPTGVVLKEILTSLLC